jgi:hypothetical protein
MNVRKVTMRIQLHLLPSRACNTYLRCVLHTSKFRNHDCWKTKDRRIYTTEHYYHVAELYHFPIRRRKLPGARYNTAEFVIASSLCSNIMQSITSELRAILFYTDERCGLSPACLIVGQSSLTLGKAA